jgi:chorismate mutase-like protein
MGRPMNTAHALLCCLAAALAATPAHAQAPSRLDQVLARGVLRVGTTGDYRPFSFRLGATGETLGLDVELATDLARSLGVRLELVPTSWARLSEDLEADAFDLALGGVTVTLERQRRALFSSPYLEDGKTALAPCAKAPSFQTLEAIDAPGVKLLVNPGGTNERFARERAPRASLVVNADNLTVFERLARGEADVMLTDAIEARLEAGLHPQLCAVHPEAPFVRLEKAALLPRDWVLKAYVDQWLHQLLRSGALERAVARWLAFPWGLERLRRAVDQRLALASQVAMAKWNSRAPIEDLARERQVLQGLGREAAALGLPAGWAEEVFRAQIEASKTVQRERFERWQEAKAGPFEKPPDLARELRPRLDALTHELMGALAESYPVLKSPARHAEVERALGSLDAAAVSSTAARQALAPLVGASAGP